MFSNFSLKIPKDGSLTCVQCAHHFKSKYNLAKHIERKHVSITFVNFNKYHKKYFVVELLLRNLFFLIVTIIFYIFQLKANLFVCSMCHEEFDTKMKLKRHENLHVRNRQIIDDKYNL